MTVIVVVPTLCVVIFPSKEIVATVLSVESHVTPCSVAFSGRTLQDNCLVLSPLMITPLSPSWILTFSTGTYSKTVNLYESPLLGLSRDVTLIVVSPGATAVTRPSLTVATSVLDEFHTTACSDAVVGNTSHSNC
ncbi:MAG: hypothetical protein MJ200_01270 [Mycoplasmoidaceae bacterium]|nr:hypothetical protein [Mycoplasmoidaceae bacterium]